MATIQDKSDDQELEQYGVWVKAGPDDVDTLDPEDSTESTSGDSDVSSNLADADFSLEEFSLEEDDLGESQDDFSIEEVRLDEESEDFDADVFGELEKDSADGGNALTPEEEELLAPLEAQDSPQPRIDIDDIDFDADLSDLDHTTDEPGEELDSANDDISSLDTLPGGVSDNLSLDDITIDDEEELPELESEAFGDQEADLDTIGDLEDFSVSAEYESDLPHEGKHEKETDHVFDDVGAVTDEMSSIETGHGQDDAMNEDTTTHLRTIESELSVIKSELFALRKELAGLRGGKAKARAHGPDDDLATEEPDDADGGFFDDDEDETIALTGDELDNILNTAEFTEEAPDPRHGAAAEFAESEASDAEAFDLETLDEPLDDQTDIESTIGHDDGTIIGDDVTTHSEETVPESPEAQDDRETDRTFDNEIELSDEDLLPTELYETSDAEGSKPQVEDSASTGESPIDIEEELDEDELDIEALDFDESLDSFDDELDITSLDAIPDTPTEEPMAPLDAASPSPVYEEAAEDEDEEPIEEIVLEDLDDDSESEAEDVESEAEDLIEEWEIGDGTETPAAVEASPAADPTLGPSDDEVTALAEMDIDSELAGIDELTDDTDTDDIQPDISDIGDIELDVESTVGDEPESAVDIEPTSERRHSVESQLSSLPEDLKNEIRAVLTYMDQLLEALPEEKIEEFARSEHFEVYKRLFEELGLEG